MDFPLPCLITGSHLGTIKHHTLHYFQNPQDATGSWIWSSWVCTNHDQIMCIGVLKFAPPQASCCCFPEIKPPMDLSCGSSDQQDRFELFSTGISWVWGKKLDFFKIQVQVTAMECHRSLEELCPKASVTFSSTGIDSLVAIGSAVNYKNLTVLWIVTIPIEKTSLRRVFLQPSINQFLPGMSQVGSAQLWTMCLGCVSSSAPRPLEFHCSALNAWPKPVTRQFQSSKILQVVTPWAINTYKQQRDKQIGKGQNWRPSKPHMGSCIMHHHPMQSSFWGFQFCSIHKYDLRVGTNPMLPLNFVKIPKVDLPLKVNLCISCIYIYKYSQFLEDPIFHRFWQLHFQTSFWPCLRRQRADLFGHAAVLVPRQVERVFNKSAILILRFQCVKPNDINFPFGL